MAPSIVMAATSAPSVMMTASASAHVTMPVSVAALHHNHRIILRRESTRRGGSQSGKSRHRHDECGSQRRDAN